MNIYDVYNAHFWIRYRGVQAVKCPLDYVLFQMIINEIVPDLIIEIGTNKGGSALYMADLLDLTGQGMVHTVDIEERVVSPLVLNHRRIKYFPLGGYAGYDLKEAAGYKKVMVIDDGSHAYEDVKQALKKFSPLVSVNSYYIVEDGGVIDQMNMAHVFGGGPTPAIQEFLAKNLDFVIDHKFCRFFGPSTTSFNGNGYLRKIS